MTEDVWEVTESGGTLLESVRRHARLPFAIAGRKYRLIACALFRSAGHEITEAAFWDAIVVTEQYADRKGSFAAIREAIDGVPDALGVPGFVHPTMTLRAMTRNLVAPDPFTAAYHAAAFHQPLATVRIPAPPVAGDSTCHLIRDIFGNPFRPVAFAPGWRTSHAVALAAGMYEGRDFAAMPILADALQEAGCDHAAVLDHCRGPGPHVRGCWVVDHVLGKA